MVSMDRRIPRADGPNRGQYFGRIDSFLNRFEDPLRGVLRIRFSLNPGIRVPPRQRTVLFDAIVQRVSE